MTLTPIDIRNFVPNGIEVEGVTAHPIDQGSFPGSSKIWFRKQMENEKIARLEVLAQEFFRLLIPGQPETRLAWNEDNNIFYVLSESIPRVRSLPKNQAQKFTRGDYKGLGLIVVIAIFLQEIDLRNSNLCLKDNKIVKIDGDWCFAALRDPASWAAKPREITPELIDALPYPIGISTYHWIGLVRKGLAQIDSEYINPDELSNTPYFRAEINQAILKILLTPKEYLQPFIEMFVPEEVELFLNFMLERQQQLKKSALQNESFQEYLQTKQALVDAKQLLQQIKEFVVHCEKPEQDGEFENLNKQVQQLLNELCIQVRSSIDKPESPFLQKTAVPQSAKENNWFQSLSFGFLSGFISTILITTAMILFQTINVFAFGLSVALTCAITAGIILIPSLIMGGVGKFLQTYATSSKGNTQEQSKTEPLLPKAHLNDTSQKIKKLETSVASLHRIKYESPNTINFNQKDKDLDLPEEQEVYAHI
jgi:hypothetical protein